jgi:hypothetical protein
MTEGLARQLTLNGLEEVRRQVSLSTSSLTARNRKLNRVESAHALLSELPSKEDLAFLHSGLCQTCLPHSRPMSNQDIWTRASGRFSLLVTPGIIDDRKHGVRHRQPTAEQKEAMFVGVPYGTKARLIMIHLQTEGLRSRTVSLGPSLSAYLRSLNLPVTGGPRGSIGAIREQCLRLARCTFSMQWSDITESGEERTLISDTKLVDGLELWRAGQDRDWCGTVELSQKFHEHLREHAVPLDKRGIAHLSGNSLGLDLYALFAYRLPRLSRDLHLSWEALQEQIGTDYAEVRDLAKKVRAVLPDVHVAYPHAKVEALPSGLRMKKSRPTVPEKTLVSGFKLV